MEYTDTVEEYWDNNTLNIVSSNYSPDSKENFKNDIKSYLNLKNSIIDLMPSGNISLLNIIRNRKTKKKGVLVPAFTCSVVKKSINESGCYPVYYDFQKRVGNYNWNKVMEKIHRDIGVIIITHLYGVPINFNKLKNYAKNSEIILIEDCAHTLGAKIGDEPIGSIGDASIFSFNYDKPISLCWGGIAVYNTKDKFNFRKNKYPVLADSAEKNLIYKFVDNLRIRRLNISKENLFSTKLLKRLRIYKNPELSNKNNYNIGNLQAELGIWCLKHYEYNRLLRNKNFNILLNTFQKDSIWRCDNENTPAYLKGRIRMRNEKVMRKISRIMQNNGIRAGNFNWPSPISKNKIYKYSQEASKYWMDIPIHQNLTAEKSSLIKYILENEKLPT